MTSYLMIGIIISGIIVSMGFGTYMYTEYQPNFIFAQSGQPIQVGPVVYTVEYIGEHSGDKDIQPKNIFFKIKITAENISAQPTFLSGGQFYLLDETEKKYSAVYGKFNDEDLFNDNLKPNVPVTRTTQFDILYDEDAKYRVGILPTKEQSSKDIGIVCIKNC